MLLCVLVDNFLNAAIGLELAQNSIETIKRLLAVRADKEFSLLKADTKPGIEVTYKKRNSKTWVCSITVDTSKITKDSNIILHTDYPGIEELTVPVKINASK